MKITIAHLLVLLFSSLCLSEAFAENKTKEFRDYLPSLVKRDKYLLAEVENTLNTYGLLDPRIIFLYLEHLELKYTQQISSAIKNRQTLLKKMVAEKEYQRGQWAARQIKLLNTLQYPDRTKKALFESYESFLRPKLQLERARVPSDADPNKRTFFAYLWVAGQAAGEYDSGTDYKTPFTEILKKHREAVHKQIVIGSPLRHSQFSLLLDQLISLSWQQEEFWEKMVADFTQVQIRTPWYSRAAWVATNTSSTFGFQIYNARLLGIGKIQVPEDAFTRNRIDPVSLDFESNTGVELSGGGRITLKSAKGIERYLFFQFGVSKQGLSNKFKTIEVFKYNRAFSVANFGTISGVSLDYNSHNSFLFNSQASISVLNFLPIIIVELGIDYRFLYISGSFDIIRENFVLWNPAEDAKDFPNTVEYETKGHIISPVIATRIILPWRFTLRGGVVLAGQSTVSGYRNKAQLITGIHYNFRF